MNSLGIHSSQGRYNSYFTQKNSSLSIASPNAGATKSDTVQISAQAKELAGNIQSNHSQVGTSRAVSDQNLPLEAFSLPGWYTDLNSDYVMVDSELGTKYSESNRARYDTLSSKDKNDLSEYQNTLQKHFQEGLQQLGIESPADYYKNIVLNQQGSEELHQVVHQSLAADSRAMELMKQFGITL